MAESNRDEKYRKASTTNADAMDAFLYFLAAKGFAPDLIFDVGAAKGAWAEMARHAFPDAHLHLFEPLAGWRNDLESMCAKLGGGKLGGAQFTQAAVGAASGSVEMERHDIPTRSLVPLPGRTSTNPMETVAMVTVDDVMAAHYGDRTLSFLKVDVQGYEIPVLEGASRALQSCEVVVLECSLFPFFGSNTPIFNDIYSHMVRLGFVLFDIPTLMRRAGDHALGQIDACFVRDSSPLRQMRSHVLPFDWPSARPVSCIPVHLVFGSGFHSPQFDDDREWRWAEDESVLFIANRRDHPAKVRFFAQLGLAGASAGEVRYTIDGGEEKVITCSGNRVLIDLEVPLAANAHAELRFHGPANINLFNRAVSFRFINYRIQAVKPPV